MFVSYKNNYHIDGLRSGTLELSVKVKNTVISFKQNTMEANGQLVTADRPFGNGEAYVKKITDFFYSIDGLLRILNL